MYVFKHVESNQYFAGQGWYTRLTPDIKKARIFLKPELAYPRARYIGGWTNRNSFTIVPVEIREARNLRDTGEEE